MPAISGYHSGSTCSLSDTTMKSSSFKYEIYYDIIKCDKSASLGCRNIIISNFKKIKFVSLFQMPIYHVSAYIWEHGFLSRKQIPALATFFCEAT